MSPGGIRTAHKYEGYEVDERPLFTIDTSIGRGWRWVDALGPITAVHIYRQPALKERSDEHTLPMLHLSSSHP